MLLGTHYTHEDNNDLVCIVDPYMHEVDFCPRVYMIVQKNGLVRIRVTYTHEVILKVLTTGMTA